MSIISLLGRIKNDEIVLPAIQRDFVWDEWKIQTLLDSILRGYPVGIALLWETYHELQYRSFIKDYRQGTLASFSDNGAKKRLQVVLDGQQRLQSLYIALFGSFEGKNLCFDVLSGKDQEDVSSAKFIFEFADSSTLKEWNDKTKAQLKKPLEEWDDDFYLWYYIKVSDLFVMSAASREKLVGKLQSDLNLSADDVSRLRVNLSALDYAISKDETSLKLTVIDEHLQSESEERKTEADVLEIFVRVNTAGTRLNRSDLIFSMLKLNWKESSEALPDFVHRINQGNSIGLTTDFVIRCLFAVSDLGAKFNLDVLRNRKNVQTLRDNFARCCDAIKATVDFLTQRCWIQNSYLIGGQTVLVPFVYYLFHTKNHRIPNPEISHARLAVYWFGFSRCFSRYGESRVGAFIRDALKPLADAGDESFPLEKAVGWVSHWESVGEFGTELLQRNHHLALHVIQELNGAQVQYEGNYPEVDHIFPRATLREKGFDEGVINNFANFWILAREKNRNKSDSHPKKYFENVDEQEMNRALIDRNMLDFSQFQSFIQKRSEQIVAKVREKLGAPSA